MFQDITLLEITKSAIRKKTLFKNHCIATALTFHHIIQHKIILWKTRSFKLKNLSTCVAKTSVEHLVKLRIPFQDLTHIVNRVTYHCCFKIVLDIHEQWFVMTAYTLTYSIFILKPTDYCQEDKSMSKTLSKVWFF